MNIPFETVERLQKRTGQSWRNVKEALVQADGDELDALIILEEASEEPTSNNSYSYSSTHSKKHATQSEWKDKLKRGASRAKAALKKLHRIKITVDNKRERVLTIPATVAILITLIAPWLTMISVVVAMLAGLTFGIQKKFQSPLDQEQ